MTTRSLACLLGLLALAVWSCPVAAADPGDPLVRQDRFSVASLDLGEGTAAVPSPYTSVPSLSGANEGAGPCDTGCEPSSCNICGCEKVVTDGCDCFLRMKPCGECCWQFDASILLWLPGMTGDITVRGREVEVDSTPLDVLDALDKLEFLFMGQVRAYYGPWSVSLAGMTVTFGDSIDAQERATSVGVEMDMTVVEAYVSYCLGECPLDNCGCPGRITYELYLGIRYFSLGLEIDPARLPGVEGDQDFVDPTVGALVKWDLGNRWMLDLQTDIGGFGIGSDLSWSVRVGAGYSFSRLFSLDFGFKALAIDYEDGAGTSKFAWDATMWGPYLALRFHF